MDATSFLPRRRHRSLFAALASAPFVTLVTGPADSPPALGTRTDRPSASHEVSPVPFSVHWSRRTVRSYHASDHPASAFVQPRHPRQGVNSPMRFFLRLASPLLSVSRCGDAARAGHSWPVLCSAHVPDSRIGQLSRPDRDRQSPGDARGIHISPFAVLLSSAGENTFRRPSHPPAVSPLAAASFIVAESTCKGRPRVDGRGSWGLAPRERTVPCDPPAPPWLLRTGPIKSTSRYCLGLPDPFSGFHRRPPVSTSGAFPPMGFSRGTQRFCRDHVVMPHAPFGVMGGRRLAGPAVFPFGSVSPSKVFAPANERFADSRRRHTLWIFFTDAQGVVRG